MEKKTKILLILLSTINICVLIINFLTVKPTEAKDYSPYIEMIKRHDADIEKIDSRLDERDPIIDKLTIDFYEIDSVFIGIDSVKLNNRLDGFMSRRHNGRALGVLHRP